MSVATSTAIIAASAIGVAGSVAGSVIGGNAAKSAAQTQAAAADKIGADAKAAADKASGIVTDASAAANQKIDLANQQITDASGKIDAAKTEQLKQLKPYLDAGQISLAQLQAMLAPGGELSSTGDLAQNKFSFTSDDWRNDPGYEFERQQAQTALDRSAAARGVLGTGGAVKATARLETGLADAQLNSAFKRSLDTYNVNRTATLQRLGLQVNGLQQLTGEGLQATGAANTDIGNAASQVNANDNRKAVNTVQQGANDLATGKYVGDTGLRAAQIAAEATGAKATAQAAGDIGQANAINNGLTGVTRGVGSALIWGSGIPATPSAATGNTVLGPDGNPLK